MESASSGWPKPSFLATLSVNDLPDLPERPTYVATGHVHPSGSPILLRYPIINTPQLVRIINLLSIAYALRPRLRDRLTLSGRTFLRKP